MSARTNFILICATVCFVGIAGRGFAQVRGVVLDASSGTPVSGAHVTAERSGAIHVASGYTSTNGRFAFTMTDIVRLSVHMLGYRDTSIVVGAETNELTIQLTVKPIEQSEVTVTAQKRLQAIEDVPISVSAVGTREIESRAPAGLDQVLRYIPGVSVTESEVNIRGASGYARSIGSRVLLLMDGMPFLSADNGDVKFDALPLFDVERVEVVKGAGSALYGSSALGGVINVITRTPPEGTHLAISTSIGEYAQPGYDSWRIASSPGRQVEGDIGVSSGTSTTSGLLSGGYKRDEGYRLGDDYFRFHGFGKINQKLSDRSDISVSALVANEDHGGWLYWKSLSAPLEPSDSLTAVNARIHSLKSNVMAQYTLTFADSYLLQIKANELHTKFTTDPTTAGGDPGSHSTADALNTEAALSFPIGPDVFLTNGLTLTYNTVTSDLFQDHHGVLAGVYSQAEIKPIENLTATVGARFDRIAYDSLASDAQVSPKLGLSYQLTEEWSLRSSYGYGFRAPTIGERFTSSVLDGFIVRPNLSLKSERSNSFELGTTLEPEHWKFDAALFYSNFDQLIEPTFVTDQGAPFVQFQNVTKAELFGHEEEIEWYPSSDRSTLLRAGYTYVYPHDLVTNQILKFRPRHLFQAHAETAFFGVSLGADYRYISSYETYDTTLAVLVVKDGDARVPISVFDARIAYTLTSPGIPETLLTFQVSNLFNYYYVEIVGNMAPLRRYSLQIQTHI